jgi:hypothetical protein
MQCEIEPTRRDLVVLGVLFLSWAGADSDRDLPSNCTVVGRCVVAAGSDVGLSERKRGQGVHFPLYETRRL